nr:PREDICTED: F-box protein At4g00755-like isoform X2 [Musa acuminata subsp. malaccensis]
MVNYWDFLKWLGTDASTSVITLLDDPADLVRLSAVSWSLRRFGKRDCIHRAVCASSTDNYPDESIENTLESSDLVDQRPSYWSSGGQYDPGVSESLTYRLTANLCVVREIKIQPFKAFFQPDHPIYSAKFVRFRMDHSRLRQGTDNCEEQQLASDDYDKWTYVSPEFPMEQENVLQSFKLPHPVICVGGMLQIELMGRVQKQAVDDLYYICVCHVQVMGSPLSPFFEVEIDDASGSLVLKHFPQSKCGTVPVGTAEAKITEMFPGIRLQPD